MHASPLQHSCVAALCLALAACTSNVPRDAPPAATAGTVEYVDIVEVPHLVGTNLPPWAACWFPHRANPGAVRRAQPCPSEVQATATYTPRDLAGCWSIEFADGGAHDTDDPWFGAPVRLVASGSKRLRERGWGGRGRYSVEFLAQIPDSLAFDTAFYTTFWEFAPPDTLSIAATNGFSGTEQIFRVRGDTLVGMLQSFWDVIEMRMDTVSDPVLPLRGRRVACSRPTGGRRRHEQ